MRLNNQNIRNSAPETFMFLVILVLGIMYVLYTNTRFENEQKNHVLQIARSVAASLPIEDLAALGANPGDIEKPQYKVIKHGLQAIIRVNPRARFAYLFFKRDDRVYFIADSEPVGSKDYSPPGEEYSEAKPEDKLPFLNGKELITKPLQDRWGSWITVYIPIKNENTGRVIAVFGMDFNEKTWNTLLYYEIIESTILTSLFILAFFFILKIKSKNKLLKIDIRKRTLAEEALRESEEDYRLIFENSPIGLLSFNDKGTIIACNESFSQIIGTPVEGLLGLNMLGLHDKKLVHAIQKALDGEQGIYEGVYKSVTSGKISTARALFAPVNFGNGRSSGGVGFIEDISERRKAEEALQESEEKYRTIFENVQDVFYQTDLDGIIREISPSVKYFSEFHRDELIGMPVFNLYNNPEDRIHLLNEIKKTGELRDYELMLKTKNGELKYVSINASLISDAQGNPNHIDGAIRDISERKRIDEALSRSEQRQRFILESLPIAIFTSPDDKDIDTTWISGNINKITGFEMDEYLSKNDFWRSRLHPLDKERVLNTFINTPFNSEIILEYRWKCKDNQYHWFQNRSVLIENESGKEYLGVIVDINEIKHAQEEIKLLNTELEKRVQQRTLQLENTNNELEAFSYSVSHDLRAPLRGIDGWSLALLEDYDHLLDDTARLYLTRVRHESQRMGNLIDDLLKLSLVNRSQMRKVEVGISEMVRSIADRMLESNPERHCELIIQPGLVAQCDAKMIEIAITNMLDNALKFTGTTEHAKIEFGQLQAGGMPAFYIRDNGVGFDMEYAKKLFGAFQRLHKQEDFPGTGIGLATVNRIISRHGGRIWAESMKGEGSIFYFTLSSS
jgi:PAS domain S-box-containing protein